MPNFSRILSGSVIAERFQIGRMVGEGGMGVVYQARDLHSEKSVALKILTMDSERPHELRRFSREAALLADLHHPAIPAFFASGQTEDGYPYLAMEWLEGETLERRLERGLLTVTDCQKLLEQVAAVLACVHRLGVVHRDIKPSNLFLCHGRFERVVVLDFGVAYYGLSPGVTALTAAGDLVGTLEYMAPEQASPEGVITPATDIYALGLVAYECLAGHDAYPVRHAAAALARTLFEVAPPLSVSCPRVPAPLSALIERMLAKAPMQRPPDGTALSQALRELGPLSDSGEPAAALSVACSAPELRLHSLALATHPEALRLMQHRPSAERALAEAQARRALAETLSRLGGQPSFLPDNSLLLMLRPMDSAHDQAAMAARCALLIKTRWPAADVAVATGRGQATQQTLLGEVVDRAAGLLQAGRTLVQGNAQLAASAAGSIWVDALSASLLDRHFVVISLDGCGLLTGESTSAEFIRPVLGTYPPCLGRETELLVLDSILAHCRLESQAQAVLVTAPAGLGKTRLRQEFVLRAQRRSQPPTVLLGIGKILSTGTPYSILSDGLRRLCGIETVADPGSARQRVIESCTELLGTKKGLRAAAFLNRLCRLPPPQDELPEIRAARNDPKIMAEHLLGALTELLCAWCRKTPILWVLDDLQWGDALSVGLIGSLLQELESSPFMVLALGRPEVKQELPEVRDWPNLKQWPLKGLSRTASERLARFVCGDRLDATSVSRIVQQSEGSPLLLEELIRATDRQGAGEPPDTVLAILQARLQHLDAPTHLMLGRASIFGERFWRGALHALPPSVASSEVDAALQRLTKAELIAVMPKSSRQGDVEYSFRHALLRDAAYSLLREEQKRQWHGCAAAFLIQSGESDDLVVAEHFSRSSETHRAAHHLARAAEQLLEGNNLAGARSLVERGLSYLAAGDEQNGPERAVRGMLLGINATLLYRLQEPTAALTAGEEALTLLPQGSSRWSLTFYSLFSSVLMLGRQDVLRSLASRFLAVEPQPEAMAAYVESGSVLLASFSLAGERTAAQTLLFRMEHLVRGSALEDPVVEAWLQFGKLQVLRLLEASPGPAWIAGQRAANAAEKAQNRRWIGIMGASAALSEMELGLPSGEARLRTATWVLGEMVGESAHGYAASWSALMLSQQAEHPEEVIRIAEEVLVRYQRSRVFSGMARLALARVHALSGALALAEENVRSALQLLSSTPPLQLGAHAQLVRILLARNELEPASKAAEEALASLQRLGGIGWKDLEVRLAAIETKIAAGQINSVRAELRSTLQTLWTRAEQIPDAEHRQRYLEGINENAALLALAREYLDASGA